MLATGEDLEQAVFVEGYLIEVFLNNRTAITAEVAPNATFGLGPERKSFVFTTPIKQFKCNRQVGSFGWLRDSSGKTLKVMPPLHPFSLLPEGSCHPNAACVGDSGYTGSTRSATSTYDPLKPP